VGTLIVSDLHLGARTGIDLLRRERPRDALLEAVAEAERLVLLGDVLELRHGPARDALTAAAPILRALGDAMGARELLLVAGNHDYELVTPWLRGRGAQAPPAPLGLEQRVAPAVASPLAEAVAALLAPAQVTVAYPGAWLADGVWATHGHYVDCHATVPTFERLAAGLMSRLVGPLGDGPLEPEDYEARLAPLYAWMSELAERGGLRRMPGPGSVRAWMLLTGDGHRPLRARLLARGFPLGVAALNRAGLGPVSPDLSREQIRRAGVQGMAEVVRRLAPPARHVIFGHTHRFGPLPGEEGGDWAPGAGRRLHNSGSWVLERRFAARLGPSSPFWPGTCLELEEGAEPTGRRLLDPEALADVVGLAREPGAPR